MQVVNTLYRETFHDQWRALLASIGVHVLVVLILLFSLWWQQQNKPVSVAGPVVEAVLITKPGSQLRQDPAPKPRVEQQKPAKPIAPTVKPENTKPEIKPDLPVLPPVPKPSEDTKNQEKVRQNGQLPSDQQREQEERHKREQQVLEEKERQAQLERERQKQLDDIRKQREAAEQKRKQEQQKLAALEKQNQQKIEQQRTLEKQRMQELLTKEKEQGQPLPGNEGKDNDLLSHYILAIQTVVTQNWLRPDTAQVGLTCTVRIVQIPGGEVISASVIPPCNGDELSKRSLEAAVLRAQPLPYQGYEKVFARSIDFVFHYDG